MSYIYDVHIASGVLLNIGIYIFTFTGWMLMSYLKKLRPYNKTLNGSPLRGTIFFKYSCYSLVCWGTPFRAKLNNWAFIIGEKGYVSISDFWRASEKF